MVHVLLQDLERLSDTGTAHFKFIVLFLTAQAALDETAQLHAVFYPYPFGVVYLHHDTVVRAHAHVHQKVIPALQPFFH